MQWTPGQQTDPETDLGMDLLTDCQAEIIHLIHHKILDQIIETTAIPVTMIRTTDRATTEITAETEVTRTNWDTNKEIKTIKTENTTCKLRSRKDRLSRNQPIQS